MKGVAYVGIWLLVLVAVSAAEDDKYSDPSTAPGALVFERLDEYNYYALRGGVYLLSNYMLNGKVVYINQEKGYFLGWGGYYWGISHVVYLEEVLSDEGSFGVYDFTKEADPAQDWDDYEAQAVDYAALILEGKTTQENDENLGIYELSDYRGRGRPVYINEERSKILAWVGNGWLIADMSALEYVDNLVHLAVVGIDNGFTSDSNPSQGWPDYVVAGTKTLRIYLDAKVGYSDEYGLAGEYNLISDVMNGKPVYMNDDQTRYISYQHVNGGLRWVLGEAKHYFSFGILPDPTSFEGYHYTRSADPASSWQPSNFDVSRNAK